MSDLASSIFDMEITKIEKETLKVGAPCIGKGVIKHASIGKPKKDRYTRSSCASPVVIQKVRSPGSGASYSVKPGDAARVIRGS